MEHLPKVGIGVLVMKDGKCLLGKRKGSHGSGEYAFPGGHLEYMESFEACARREVFEETGLKIKNIEFQYIENIKRYNPKHYIHIAFKAEWSEGEPMVNEPEKVDSWDWYDPRQVPDPLFFPCERQIRKYNEIEQGVYFDA